jgi:hypothetical protein
MLEHLCTHTRIRTSAVNTTSNIDNRNQIGDVSKPLVSRPAGHPRGFSNGRRAASGQVHLSAVGISLVSMPESVGEQGDTGPMTPKLLPWSRAHCPYGFAVIDALERAGLTVMYYDYDYGPGEDRDMGFTLGEAVRGDEFVVGWRESEGWSWSTFDPTRPPTETEPTDRALFDLPNIATPDAVAAAVRHQLGLPPLEVEPVWSAPGGYNPNTPSPCDSGDADEAAFESTLGVYMTHPAWQPEIST